jgi:polyisoprenoid-binding protein YceI
MKTMSLVLSLLTSIPAYSAAPGNCKYTYDPAQVQIVWTAYKTTGKVPVQGHFKSTTLSGPMSGTELPALLNALTADIDATSVDAGSPARNANLLASFFKLWTDTHVHGAIVSAQGDSTHGSFLLSLTMNQQTQSIPMTYALASDGTFTAAGSLDVLNFSMGSALSALTTTCHDAHSGDDGIAKTWSTVDLLMKAAVQITCN